MGALGVEPVNEGIELGLLLKRVHPRWSCSLFFECEMHPFMAAVLLRMARFDAFDPNAEPEPPDRKFGQVEEGVGGGKGRAIVRANASRQSALQEELLESRKSQAFTGGFESFA